MNGSAVLEQATATRAKTGAQTRRVFGLDLLRALAILLVMYSHTLHYVDRIIPRQRLEVIYIDGVDIFFVLSGFLIGTILLQTLEKGLTTRSLSVFWFRRWMRTLPNYFCVLLLLIAIETVVSHRAAPSWKYFVFLQNLYHRPLTFFPESWSLCVEEWFYLGVPLFILLLQKSRLFRDSRRDFIWVVMLVLAASLAARIWRVDTLASQHLSSLSEEVRKVVIYRLDALMLGCFAAWASRYYPEQWSRRNGFGLTLGFVLWFIQCAHHQLSPGMDFYSKYLSTLVVPLGTLLMMPYLSAWKMTGLRAAPVVTWISKISYSMYLINFSLVGYIIARLSRGVQDSVALQLTQAALFWILTLSLSTLLYRFWEKPFMQLRDAVRE